jgi:thioredoxin 1
MIDIADQDFDREVLECELPVFTCFTARWCHTCYPTCLLAAGLTEEYNDRVKFVKLDIEESAVIAERYHIVAVPTILIFKDSRPVRKLISFQDKVSLKSALNSIIAEEELPYQSIYKVKEEENGIQNH